MKFGFRIATLAACLIAISPLSAAPKETSVDGKIRSKEEVRAAIVMVAGWLEIWTEETKEVMKLEEA